MIEELDLFSNPPLLIYEPKSAPRLAEGQCDCACVSAQSVESLSVVHSMDNSYALTPNFKTVPLNEEYFVTIGRDSSPVVLNRSAIDLVSQFKQAKKLTAISSSLQEIWSRQTVQSILGQLVVLGILVPEEHLDYSLVESPTVLSAWLHITDRCNLRCSYCYLPHNRVDMSAETGRAAIEATFRSAVAHGYNEVKFKYAGGEALLHFQLVAELHRYAQGLAEQHELALDGVVLSNGTLLTDEIVKTLQAMKLRLMISLDGLGNFHDRQRSYGNGRGSSADTMHAIELALRHDFVPEISITVSGRNVNGLPKLVTWILERRLPFSLNFYRENDLSSCHTDLKLEEERIIEGMLAVCDALEVNLPRRSILSSLIDRANLTFAHLHTCGVGQSYLVFDHLGHVSKCQMQINNPVTTVQARDPLAYVHADSIGIQNVSVEEKEGCRTCEWKYWCTGGCSLATYRATGRYDVKSPNCNIYKTLYPKALRLEGLRLLKYAGELNVYNRSEI